MIVQLVAAPLLMFEVVCECVVWSEPRKSREGAGRRKSAFLSFFGWEPRERASSLPSFSCLIFFLLLLFRESRKGLVTKMELVCRIFFSKWWLLPMKRKVYGNWVWNGLIGVLVEKMIMMIFFIFFNFILFFLFVCFFFFFFCFSFFFFFFFLNKFKKKRKEKK